MQRGQAKTSDNEFGSVTPNAGGAGAPGQPSRRVTETVMAPETMCSWLGENPDVLDSVIAAETPEGILLELRPAK